ncbi:MAG: hypothetical protein AB1505_34505 [Candidatus Latescibacterota bacterium]
MLLRDRVRAVGPVRGWEQVSDYHWQYALGYDRVSVDPAQVDRDAPTRLVAGVVRHTGGECVDALPVLRTDPDPRHLYFDADPHLTAAGHRRVAQAVYAHLAGR